VRKRRREEGGGQEGRARRRAGGKNEKDTECVSASRQLFSLSLSLCLSVFLSLSVCLSLSPSLSLSLSLPPSLTLSLSLSRPSLAQCRTGPCLHPLPHGSLPPSPSSLAPSFTRKHTRLSGEEGLDLGHHLFMFRV
jgi:hypothetical protein